MKTLKNIWNSKIGKIALILGVLIIGILIYRFIDNNKIGEEDSKKIKEVDYALVSNIINENSSLALVGRVESQSEAVLKTEVSGPISSVNVKLGDYVYAGQTIASIKNSLEYSSILSAQASLKSAQANLDKLTGNSDQNLSIVKNAIRNLYAISSDSVLGKTDQFFENPDLRFPEYRPYLKDFQTEQDIENFRVRVGDVLENWKTSIDNVNDVDDFQSLEKLVLESQEYSIVIQDFLGDVNFALSNSESDSIYSESDLSVFKTNASNSRSSVNSSLSSMLSNYNTLKSQISVDGNAGQDVKIAQANVQQAEASLIAAQSNYAKTLVTSPINGVVNTINIKLGDFVSVQQEVAQIIGNGELEIVTSVNQEEKDNLKVGDNVIIDNNITGKISRIAPAVSFLTQKIEVRIIPDTNENLSNDQSVKIEIIRESEIETGNEIQEIILPLSAIKITNDGNYVYQLDNENKIISKEIELGNILGNKVVINSGLNIDEKIILDVRGLKIGQEVLIK